MKTVPFDFTVLADIRPAGHVRSHRQSSYDRRGGNVDFERIPPNGEFTILEADGPGLVTHLWFALAHFDLNYMRRLVLKAWWDGESNPSIHCPLGDFFGVGHAVTNPYRCLLMNMVRGAGLRGESSGANSYLSMPFQRHARIVVANESPIPCMACYYQVDWLSVEPAQVEGLGRLHACWRRANPPPVAPSTGYENPLEWGRFAANLDGKLNYRVLDVQGAGRFLGMNLSVNNLDARFLGSPVGHFGEGDEMIFIDGENWPPALHGTGTEDYFTDAWGMTGDAGLYAGTSFLEKSGGQPPRRPKGTCYRFHVLDPVYFRRSLVFSIEHGHANHQANDLASTAYWYQEEPHQPFDLAPAEKRLPVPDPADPPREEEDRAMLELGRVVNRYYDIFIDGTREQVRALGRDELARNTVGKAGELRQKFAEKKRSAPDVLREIAPCREALARIAG